MRRLIISAYLLSAALAVGCGDDTSGGTTPVDGKDPVTTKDGGAKDAGKKDGGGGTSSSSPTASTKDGAVGMVLPATKDPFKKDATAAAGLPAGDLDKLKAGGDCSAKVLYPYKNTRNGCSP